MAITALNSAATGLRALSTRIDVIANNLANAETHGFKRSRMNFEDLMYLTLKEPGVTNNLGQPSPAGTFVGLGVKISNTQLDMEQGSLENSNRPLDVAIKGEGFFRVKIMDGVGDGTAYTRNGNFNLNRDGELVVAVGEGYKVIPGVNLPKDAQQVSISENGLVEYVQAGSFERKKAGDLKLSQFVNPQGLKLLGGGLYQETPASGNAFEGVPGEDGLGELQQGSIEGSNVDPVKELVTLIKTQRSFELNSQTIQTADQALQTIGNLRRF